MTHDPCFRCMLADDYEPLFFFSAVAGSHGLCGVTLMERKQGRTHVIFPFLFPSLSRSRALACSTTMTTVTIVIHVYPYFFFLLLLLLLRLLL